MFATHIISSLTFGRDSAQYWQLIGVLAVVSVLLWALVILTTFVRFTVGLLWRRQSRRIKDTHTTRVTESR